MLKNKIYKILPYWLISLITLSAIQIGFFLYYQKNSYQPITNNSKKEQVLGLTTSIRGENNNLKSFFEKKLNINQNQIKAKSFLVFDLESGQNLAEKNAELKLKIASLTKLLTAYTAYNHGDLNSELTVSKDAAIKINPVLNLIPEDKIKALDVFNAMLIGSCNDAALTLANFISGTKENFVSLMNLEANEIGMTNSNFSNPTGFDNENNYSTANDLKILISKTESLAAFSSLGKKTSYKFSGKLGKEYFTHATNKLISDHSDIWAIKTGYTKDAGGAMATMIEVQGRKLVILILASPDREGDTLELKKQIEATYSQKPPI